ncbi:MAG: hypothetical protein PHF29_00185 [Candidatus Riflebacteria bacterium]|nr:hypothetical protein [Candidatus Riflebacteria bacterium]
MIKYINRAAFLPQKDKIISWKEAYNIQNTIEMTTSHSKSSSPENTKNKNKNTEIIIKYDVKFLKTGF